jgi:hypothetical protein
MNLSRSIIVRHQIQSTEHLSEWSQQTMNEYYAYCLKNHVIPSFNINANQYVIEGLNKAVS